MKRISMGTISTRLAKAEKRVEVIPALFAVLPEMSEEDIRAGLAELRDRLNTCGCTKPIIVLRIEGGQK
jgi:hypothetical protein